MQEGGAAGPYCQTSASAFATPRLCHASAGRRDQPRCHSSPAGSRQPENHGPLPSRRRRHRAFHQKSGRNAGRARSGPGRGQASTGTMTEHRLEVADVFGTYESDFFAKWGHVLGPHRRKAFEAVRDCRTAALGGMWTSATSAGTAPSRTILAATGIVQNARPWRAPNGWPKGRPSCCRSRISTLYLRCLKTSVAWHSRMRARFIAFYFARHRKRCSRLPRIPNIWAPRSAFWLCFTPGDKTFISIHISTASYRAAVSHRTAPVGSVAGNRSFFLSRSEEHTSELQSPCN